MTTRLLSDKQRAWLVGELEVWRGQGLLSDTQATGILQLYETAEAVSERKQSRAVFALMSVAGVLVFLAALLLIGYNWEAMSRGVKLAIVFGLILGIHGLGFYLHEGRQARRASEILFFIGCLLYGAGIWLLAQIFHLSAHYPDGVWWWAIGVLPFALSLDTVLLHALLAFLLAVWAGLEILSFNHLPAWLFGRWVALANGAYSLPLMAALGLLWAYRKRSVTAVGIYALLITWWVMLQPFAWRWAENPTYFIGSVGALLLIVAEAHPPGSRMGIPYRLYGVLLAAGALVPLSFYEFNQEFALSRERQGGQVQTLIILLLAAATIALVAWRGRDRDPTVPTAARVMELLRHQWLPIGLALVMAFCSVSTALDQGLDANETVRVLVPTVLANIAMLAVSIWLMRVGLRDDRGRPFTAGVVYFLLWSVLRYADLFGDFGGMVGAALMFFACGAALFGLAIYWRQRKRAAYA